MALDGDDIEVIIDDAAGASAAAVNDPPRTEVDRPRQPGQRLSLDERLAQLNQRRAGAEDALAAERARTAALEQQVRALADRSQRVENVILADVAERDRGRRLSTVDQRLEELKAKKRAALNEGDTAAAADLDVEIADAVVERRSLTSAPAQVGEQSRQQPTTQPQRQLDPLQRDFIARNVWWTANDPDSTARRAYATAIHNEMKAAGQPIGDADYYAAIERAVDERFGRTRSGPAITSGNPQQGVRRTMDAGNGPVRVTLTGQQKQMIERLGLTPEQYVRASREVAKRGEPQPFQFGRVA